MTAKGAEYFKGKRVTVMGLGLLGRGVGDAAFMAECGAEVIVTDLKSEHELKASLEQLRSYSNITYRLGGHVEEDFVGRDIVLVAAGVPLDSLYVEKAREAGAEVTMSAALFAKLSGIPIIGITGTRGKSTVTHMVHHVLTHGTEGGKVLLGGNVRGVSNLQLLKEVDDDSLAVMELDSWQLQGFGWAKVSPHISVFTNFMDDHMTYYRGDRKQYFKDKAQIFLHQEESGVLVTTPEVFELAKEYLGADATVGQEIVLVDGSNLPEDCLLSMPGAHNRLNAALALEALKATGLTEEEVLEWLPTFPGVPGRLEFLGEHDGVKIYNDNNATTPEATAAALRALDSGVKNIVLIVGGTDKEADASVLGEVVGATAKHVVLYSGTGTEKLRPHLPDDISKEEHETLKECVEAALRAASPGDIILFSPAFSSFGKEYRNEYDRNDQFVALIRSHAAS